jgi:hypothetical protein
MRQPNQRRGIKVAEDGEADVHPSFALHDPEAEVDTVRMLTPMRQRNPTLSWWGTAQEDAPTPPHNAVELAVSPDHSGRG